MTEWSVLVEVSDADDKPLEWEDERLDEFMDLLDEHDGIVSGLDGAYSARLTVDADDAVSATITATDVFHEMAAKAGLPSWLVTRTEAVTHDELEAELSKPSFPDLVGAAEAARELGVSRQRFAQLVRAKPDFPGPMLRLAATPVWMRAAIQKFDEDWDRTPGRPRKTLQGA